MQKELERATRLSNKKRTALEQEAKERASQQRADEEQEEAIQRKRKR
jgi:hypothetical protein